MKTPKTVWKWSAESEAARILSIAYDVRNRFFSEKGFFVLPYLVPGHPQIVFFPPLPYRRLPGFWKKAKQKTPFLQKRNDPIIGKVIKILDKNPPDYSHLQKSWQGKEKKFWPIANSLLPGVFKKVKYLEIRPTRYGTKCTAYSHWLNDRSKIVVYLRADVDVGNIAKGILLDRLYDQLSRRRYTWEEKQAIMDFLITDSSLGKLFPRHQSTSIALRKKQQAKLAKDAQQYLVSLGINGKTPLKTKGGEIFWDNKKIKLTKREGLLLDILIKNKGRTVSFDRIANRLWGRQAEEKFSLYAIAKLAQRTRKKVSQAGVCPEIIQARKGKGYLLM